jgi:hypothetical protein
MTVLTVTVVVAVWAAVAPSNAGPQTNAKARLMPLLKRGMPEAIRGIGRRNAKPIASPLGRQPIGQPRQAAPALPP